MKTLILYATKHGATRKIAEKIAQQMNDATLVELKRADHIDLGGYACVIIGSALYAGMVRKEAKDFVTQHASELKAKSLGLFLSGISDNDATSNFEANYDKSVIECAKAKSLLGGVFDPAKANFFEKLIMRMVAKKSAYTDTISDEKIKQFTEAMRA